MWHAYMEIKPVIDQVTDGDIQFPENAKKISEALRTLEIHTLIPSAGRHDSAFKRRFREFAGRIEAACCEEQVDAILGEVYAYADYERIWMDTYHPGEVSNGSTR